MDYVGDLYLVMMKGAELFVDSTAMFFSTMSLITKIKNETGEFPKPYGLGSLHIYGGKISKNYSKFSGRNVGLQLTKLYKFEAVNVDFYELSQANHLLDMSGCGSVLIQNCTFHGMSLPEKYKPTQYKQIASDDTNNNVNLELVQIDVSNGIENAGMGDTDVEPCNNVIIENCVFTTSDNANSVNYRPIGMHTPPKNNLGTKLYYENIVIRNNKFYNTLGRAICLFATKNARIEGNYFESVETLIDDVVMIGGSDSTQGYNDCVDTDNIVIANNIFNYETPNNDEFNAISFNKHKIDNFDFTRNAVVEGNYSSLNILNKRVKYYYERANDIHKVENEDSEVVYISDVAPSSNKTMDWGTQYANEIDVPLEAFIPDYHGTAGWSTTLTFKMPINYANQSVKVRTRNSSHAAVSEVTVQLDNNAIGVVTIPQGNIYYCRFTVGGGNTVAILSYLQKINQ